MHNRSSCEHPSHSLRARSDEFEVDERPKAPDKYQDGEAVDALVQRLSSPQSTVGGAGDVDLVCCVLQLVVHLSVSVRLAFHAVERVRADLLGLPKRSLDTVHRRARVILHRFQPEHPVAASLSPRPTRIFRRSLELDAVESLLGNLELLLLLLLHGAHVCLHALVRLLVDLALHF